MGRGLKFLLGLLLVATGIIISLKSLSLTGQVIGNVSSGVGSILGVILIIAGALVYLAGVFDFE